MRSRARPAMPPPFRSAPHRRRWPRPSCKSSRRRLPARRSRRSASSPYRNDFKETAMRKTVLSLAAATSLVFATAGAFAAELKVYVSGAMAHALEEISKDFAKKNGHTLDFVVGTTGVLQERVRKGEKADLKIGRAHV